MNCFKMSKKRNKEKIQQVFFNYKSKSKSI